MRMASQSSSLTAEETVEILATEKIAEILATEEIEATAELAESPDSSAHPVIPPSVDVCVDDDHPLCAFSSSFRSSLRSAAPVTMRMRSDHQSAG